MKASALLPEQIAMKQIFRVFEIKDFDFPDDASLQNLSNPALPEGHFRYMVQQVINNRNNVNPSIDFLLQDTVVTQNIAQSIASLISAGLIKTLSLRKTLLDQGALEIILKAIIHSKYYIKTLNLVDVTIWLNLDDVDSSQELLSSSALDYFCQVLLLETPKDLTINFCAKALAELKSLEVNEAYINKLLSCGNMLLPVHLSEKDRLDYEKLIKSASFSALAKQDGAEAMGADVSYDNDQQKGAERYLAADLSKIDFDHKHQL